MDAATILIIGALIVTAITLSIILLEALRILWKLMPNWFRLAFGSFFAAAVIILVVF